MASFVDSPASTDAEHLPRGSFLNLPPELRNQIYHYVFLDARIYPSHVMRQKSLQVALRAGQEWDPDGYANQFSLLLACRQIHHETLAMFYDLSTFVLYISRRGARFMCSGEFYESYCLLRPQVNILKIKKLRVEVCREYWYAMRGYDDKVAWVIKDNIRTACVVFKRQAVLERLEVAWIRQPWAGCFDCPEYRELERENGIEITQPIWATALDQLGCLSSNNITFELETRIIRTTCSCPFRESMPKDQEAEVRFAVAHVQDLFKSPNPHDELLSRVGDSWLNLKDHVLQTGKLVGAHTERLLDHPRLMLDLGAMFAFETASARLSESMNNLRTRANH